MFVSFRGQSVGEDVGTVSRGGGETDQQTGAQQVPAVPGPAGAVALQHQQGLCPPVRGWIILDLAAEHCLHLRLGQKHLSGTCRQPYDKQKSSHPRFL